MNIRTKFLEALNSDSKETFLIALGHHLGISARDTFTGDPLNGQREARACNEMMIAIWSQVWAVNDENVRGYPDSDFLSILIEKADAGDARHHLRNAIEIALSFVSGSESLA
ncbi:hypothetical protein [Thermomonospora catenispora]|uniref:hypothetical protein n=1 Tax=Thermomonospora catenispora TaxID=2493090 RepID=UPI0011238CFD|nr:hypothetical protein [Thermomonospora catenispora]TNY37958.1 hypothetical protein EIO00_05110 [Thermomonospora catenispora]